MFLKLSKSIVTLTFLLVYSLYGCTPRQDLAPVRTDDGRINGYLKAAPGQSQKTNRSNREQSIIEQRTAGNNTVQDKKKLFPVQNAPVPQRLHQDRFDSDNRYHTVTEEETLFSIGVRTGHGFEKLAMWNQIPPPYKIETGQQIRLFGPVVDDNFSSGKQIMPKLAANRSADSLVNKSINSNNKLKKTGKLTVPKQIMPKKSSIKNKKKSIISIDNKNMLMLNFQWPIKGKIKKDFFQSDKKGVDIVGEIGQTVRAAEAGKVVYSGQGLIGLGNLLIIKHNDEYLSAYANNSSLLVKEGRQVEKGQGIAKVGVAVSKEAILHFEIRKNGKSVDPLALLPKK